MKNFDPYSIVISLNQLNDLISAANQTNIFKDYIMPIFVVILSALTAYLIAIKGYEFQETSKNERSKADSLNKTVLQMQSMLSNLIATKRNYFDTLTENPMQRALNLPIMPMNLVPVEYEPNALAQLLYTRKVDTVKHPWMSMASFVATYGNYNLVTQLIKTRNHLCEEVYKVLDPLYSSRTENGEVQVNAVYDLLGEALSTKYIDLTERVIALTDDLIVTIYDSLLNFPKEASKSLNKKHLKNYVYLFTYENQHQDFEKMLKRCTKVDLNILSKIMKISREEAGKYYKDLSTIITTPNTK
ncbi:hypothetical protein ACXO4R_001097 [Cronobacter sakazakii]|nr:hypothetical protein [Cronobacter muytjensii]